MAQDKRDVLELLKFELKFLEDGGYGRSPHAPRREPQMLRGFAQLSELSAIRTSHIPAANAG